MLLTLGQTTSPQPLAPALILSLCAVAGVGTALLLPGKREASIRAIGGVVLLAAGAIFAAMLVRWTSADSRGGMGFYFWIFSIIAIVAAVRVVTHTKPVYSALYFVLTIFASAGLFVLLWADFLAIALVLIYAGAILVTYVFVIMLASEAASPMKDTDHDLVSREPVAACAVGFVLMAILLTLIFDKAQLHQTSSPIVDGTTQAVGEFLFKDQIISLELAGLILTIAMVGAIMIARKRVIVFSEEAWSEAKPDVVIAPATPVDDNPHSIPVEGTRNPRQKAFPER